MKMKKPETVVINKQRITKVAHNKIKRLSESEMVDQQAIIRRVLHHWATGVIK